MDEHLKHGGRLIHEVPAHRQLAAPPELLQEYPGRRRLHRPLPHQPCSLAIVVPGIVLQILLACLYINFILFTIFLLQSSPK